MLRRPLPGGAVSVRHEGWWVHPVLLPIPPRRPQRRRFPDVGSEFAIRNPQSPIGNRKSKIANPLSVPPAPIAPAPGEPRGLPLPPPRTFRLPLSWSYKSTHSSTVSAASRIILRIKLTLTSRLCGLGTTTIRAPLCMVLCLPPSSGPVRPAARNLRTISRRGKGVSCRVTTSPGLPENTAVDGRHLATLSQGRHDPHLDGINQVLACFLETVPLGKTAGQLRHLCDHARAVRQTVILLVHRASQGLSHVFPQRHAASIPAARRS